MRRRKGAKRHKYGWRLYKRSIRTSVNTTHGKGKPRCVKGGRRRGRSVRPEKRDTQLRFHYGFCGVEMIGGFEEGSSHARIGLCRVQFGGKKGRWEGKSLEWGGKTGLSELGAV